MEAIKKFLRNKMFKKILLLIVIPVVIIFILFSSSLYVIEIEDGTYEEGDDSNTPYVVDQSVSSALEGIAATDESDTESMHDVAVVSSADGGYRLDIDLGELTETILTTLRDNGSNIDTYLTNSSTRNTTIRKMIEAELATQYPDLRSSSYIGTETSDENEFQGVIKFIRHKSDGSEKVLEYMPLGGEDSTDTGTLLGLINSGNDSCLNYFSIDTQGNLIVANWSEKITASASGSYSTDYVENGEGADYVAEDRTYLDINSGSTEYTYSTKVVNYQSSVSKYTMPFEYLWAFMVTGKDEEFVSDLADLVLASSIEISIYDNLTITETEVIEAYNDNTWVSSRTQQKVLDGNTGHVISFDSGEWSEPTITTNHNYTINYEKNYSNTIVIALTYADIWMMTYTSEYTYEEGEETNPGLAEYDITRSTDLDEEFSEDDYEITEGVWYTDYYIENAEGVSDIHQKKIDTREQTKTNQHTTTSSNNSKQYKYTLNGDPEIKEKTDKTLEEGDEGYPNFCTLYVNSEKAKSNLSDSKSWLFEIIQKNETTVDMLDLTKYLFYCITGVNYGVKTFDFSIFNTDSFNTIGTTSSGLLKEYIHYWENSGGAPTNADGTMYIVEDDGAGHPTVGYGVDIYRCGHTDLFIEAGYDLSYGAEIDVDFVDAIEDMEIQEKTQGIQAAITGLSLTGYQQNALVSRAYNCGTGSLTSSEEPGAIGIRSGKNFVQAYQAYWNESDDQFEEKNPNANYSHELYTNYMSKPTTSGGDYLPGLERRRKSEWTLFQTGYYDVLDKWHTDSDGQYYQNDYADVPYGSGSLATCGCGPTAFAMVATRYSGTTITPKDAIAWCGNSYYVSGERNKLVIF